MELLVIAVIALVAFAAVLIPLFRTKPGGDDSEFTVADTRLAPQQPLPDPALAPMASGPVPAAADLTPHETEFQTEDDVEREILRYRAAVRAGTLCRRCGQANPADSAFCFECGAALPRADAKEFE